MAHIRRLAAIMFTDIEGYTALMQRSESEAVKTRQRHREVFNPITKKYEGQIVQYYGDGTLSVFNSAISAVKCAIELQQHFNQDRRIPVRIGIHTGDIIITDDDIIGDSVNLASRIESMAMAGSILISSKVFEEIKNQEDLAVRYLGTFQLKNDQEQREIYAIDHSDLVVPDTYEISDKAIAQSDTNMPPMVSKVEPSDRKDVFISYAQMDDIALTREESGWISMFDQALRKRTAQLLGYQPIIWRDQQQLLDEEILQQFVKLKVMISILSPRYLESKNCMAHLKEFYSIAKQKGGMRVNNKWRIFKVIKTPVPPELQPPEMEGILGYEFYEISEDGRFREFTLDKRSPNYYQFLERFEDVAQDLSQVIRSLELGKTTQQSASKTEAKKGANAVYLAKTTSDLNSLRDNIRRDLEMRGYLVLPEEELPLDQRFRETVQENLAKCQLSVLLLGGKYGLVPEDEEHSVPMIQYRLSMEAGLPCLMWKPENLTAGDIRQQSFLDLVCTDPPNHEFTEVLTDEFEDFKTHLMDTLNNLAPPAEDPMDDEQRPPRVYLIYDRADSDAARVIDDHLYNLGFEVLKPLFEGSETELREMHQDNLRICDAALIYYDYGSEFWLNAKINDLRKALGFGRTKPINTKAVYVSGEKNPSKEGFRSRELAVIKQFEQFSEASLSSFTEKLRQSS